MVGSLCGLIGVYIVLRGMSYIGHGLSHAAFGGAVVGFTLNLNFYVGAGAMGLLAALLINMLTKDKNQIRCRHRHCHHCIFCFRCSYYQPCAYLQPKF